MKKVAICFVIIVAGIIILSLYILLHGPARFRYQEPLTLAQSSVVFQAGFDAGQDMSEAKFTGEVYEGIAATDVCTPLAKSAVVPYEYLLVSGQYLNGYATGCENGF